MPPGFLAVLTHPSSSLSLADFHAWYEEEHIPLRLNHLPSFLSGARYEAVDLPDPSPTPSPNPDSTPTSDPFADPPSTDGPHPNAQPNPDENPQPDKETENLKENEKDKETEEEKEEEPLPTWLALYEIDDTATFSAPSYTGLREKRSAREADVMRRLDVLVRWAGEEVGVWYAPSSGSSTEPQEGRTRTTGLKPGHPSRCVVTHTLSLTTPSSSPSSTSDPDTPVNSDSLVKSWAARVVRAASATSTHEGKEKEEKVKGFVSTRVVRVIEGGRARMGVPVEMEKAGYFVVHEFESDQDASDTDTGALRTIISSLSSLDIGTADQSSVGPSSVGSSSDGPWVEEKGIEEEGNNEEEGKWKMKVDMDIDNWRVWALHKAYPCIAQGNLGDVGVEAGLEGDGGEGDEGLEGGEAGVGGVDFYVFGE